MLTNHTERMWEGFKKLAHIAIMAGCVCGTVGMLYVHRRVIGAWLKGEELPKPPEGHPCVCHTKNAATDGGTVAEE